MTVDVDAAVAVALTAVDAIAARCWATTEAALLDALDLDDDELEEVREYFVADHAVNRQEIARSLRQFFGAVETIH